MASVARFGLLFAALIVTFAQLATAGNPSFAITCTRDKMTIVATGSAATDVLHVDDSDQDSTGTAINGCENNLTPNVDVPAIPVYTLEVDFTITKNSLALTSRPADPAGTCPSNVWPQLDTGVQVYEKKVIWTTGNAVQVEESIPPSGTKGSTTYVVTCTFQDLHSADTGIANVEANMALSTVIPTTSLADPVPTFTVVKSDLSVTPTIHLNDELTLTAGFTDTDGALYWEYLTVHTCQASTTNAFPAGSLTTDIVTNGCPTTNIGDYTDLITNMLYTESTSTGSNADATYQDRKTLTMKFKAFRFNTVRNVFFKCSVLICPRISAATNCPIPTELASGADIAQASTCTNINTRSYEEMMMDWRVGRPSAYAKTLTFSVSVEDAEDGSQKPVIKVDTDNKGKTCMESRMFTLVITSLSLLLVLALVVAVVQSVRSKRSSASSKEFFVSDGIHNPAMHVKSVVP